MRQPVTVIEGRAVPLDRSDIDTDQIIPGRHLRRIERTGFGKFLFELWCEDPSFVLNDPQRQGASILIAGDNFGCGSSREHAPWALKDFGFRAIVAPSFADIFKGNAGNIGLAIVSIPKDACDRLMELVTENHETEVSIDLVRQVVKCNGEFIADFEIDPFTKILLVEGLDFIDYTLEKLPEIIKFEDDRPAWMPSTDKKRGDDGNL